MALPRPNSKRGIGSLQKTRSPGALPAVFPSRAAAQEAVKPSRRSVNRSGITPHEFVVLWSYAKESLELPIATDETGEDEFEPARALLPPLLEAIQNLPAGRSGVWPRLIGLRWAIAGEEWTTTLKDPGTPHAFIESKGPDKGKPLQQPRAITANEVENETSTWKNIRSKEAAHRPAISRIAGPSTERSTIGRMYWSVKAVLERVLERAGAESPVAAGDEFNVFVRESYVEIAGSKVCVVRVDGGRALLSKSLNALKRGDFKPATLAAEIIAARYACAPASVRTWSYSVPKQARW